MCVYVFIFEKCNVETGTKSLRKSNTSGATSLSTRNCDREMFAVRYEYFALDCGILDAYPPLSDGDLRLVHSSGLGKRNRGEVAAYSIRLLRAPNRRTVPVVCRAERRRGREVEKVPKRGGKRDRFVI